jgi:GH24 family phage-related lysozyme (muramidase)
MTYIEQAAQDIESFEGKIPWLYRDTRGNVTVGVGKMLPDVDAALKLPFLVGDPAQRADELNIRKDWARIMEMPFGQNYAAGFYRSPASVYLADATISDLLCSVLSDCDAELHQLYPNFHELADPAKVRLLDMAYNLGISKLRTGYPRFNVATCAADYVSMGAECNRNGIPNERNQWTATGFIEAKG